MDHNDEALRQNLDLLDEKSEQVLKHIEDYQRKTARYWVGVLGWGRDTLNPASKIGGYTSREGIS